MQNAAARLAPERVGTALSLIASLAGLVLIGLGAALLTGELFNILDQDVRWRPLLLGAVATGFGVIIFIRSSRGWNQGGGPPSTPWARIGRSLVAIVAVGVAVVAFATVGVLIAGPVSDLSRFEDNCSEMDSIICGFQGAIGGAVAGLVFGIRAAIGAIRGLWIPVLALFVAVAGLAAWLVAGQA